MPDSAAALQVLRGYTGDRNDRAVFSGFTPFDMWGTGYLRPNELATLRLFNLVGILPRCTLGSRTIMVSAHRTSEFALDLFCL
jgi:hypothetical protein